MSKIEVNEIDKQSGSTLTLGGSGTAVTLACGATQSGFGRSGSVNWQTTKKTTNFTAANGEGYFVDTTSGGITMTLPSSPSAGAIVAVKDYTGTFESNALTIGRGGSNIRGSASDSSINKNNAGATLVYIDATEGWQIFADGSDTDILNPFVQASGGTETTCGNCKVHTFTGPGTFAVSAIAQCATNNVVSYAVVAGGGGGASNQGSWGGGGGGAGGYREVKSPSTGSYTASPLDGYPSAPNRVTLTATSFPITVGGGGAGGAACGTGSCGAGTNGSNSIFSTITSTGGGGGGPGWPTSRPDSVAAGKPGGSGGGGTSSYYGGPSGTPAPGGSGNTPPTTPSQGNNGGSAAVHPPARVGGGGGGAGGTGGGGSGSSSGPGGNGVTTAITGAPVVRGGGGGAGGIPPCSSAGSAGSGGGGAGSGDSNPGSAGTANTGGGGGGSGPSPSPTGGNGGSGVVIIRYRFQ